MPDKQVLAVPRPADCQCAIDLDSSVAPAPVSWPPETEVGSSASPGNVICPHQTEVGSSVAPGRVICPPETEVGSSTSPGNVILPHAITLGDPSGSQAERSSHWILVSASTHEKRCRAPELFGTGEPARQLGRIFDRALDALIARLARRRSRTTPKPRAPRGRRGVSVRHIPPDVRRAVWSRDGGQCAFVGIGGMRCSGKRGLEFDVVTRVEPGHTWAVEDVQLLCRVHKEYVVECRAEHVPYGEP